MFTVKNLSLGVAEDDSLSDRKRIVKVAKGIELPLFTLNSNEKLLDPFQRQLITRVRKISQIKRFELKEKINLKRKEKNYRLTRMRIGSVMNF